MNSYAYGIDVGGTAIKIGLFTAQGSLERKWSIPTDRSDGGEHVLMQIADLIRSQPIPLSQVIGVGTGLPGPIQADGTVNRCVNLGWEVVPAAEQLSALLEDLPVRVINDANAAALGECWQGGGVGADSVLLVTMGTGIGSGLVIHGKVLHGANGSAGEIGHLLVNPQETELCACGRRGCLEQYASATGLVRTARRNGLNVSNIKELFDLVRANDPDAYGVIMEAATVLGRALANVACMVNPEVILLGGGVSVVGDPLLIPVREAFQANVFYAAAEPRFEFAKLGNDAGMYGAARMILSDQP